MPETLPLTAAETVRENEDILPDNSPNLTSGSRTVTQFSREINPRTFREGLISKNGVRKHILPDSWGETPEADIQYVVDITRDTNPYDRTRGALISRVVRPTQFGELQLKMRAKGFEARPYTIGKIRSDGRSVSDEEAAEWYKTTFSIEKDQFEIRVMDSGPGQLDEPDQTVYTIWTRKREDGESPEHVTDLEFTQTQTNTATPTLTEIAHAPEVLKTIPPIEFMKNGKLRILDLEVDRIEHPGKRVPSASKFEAYTLDKQTLELVYRIASAYSRRSPFFVEGSTATSKTSAAEFFAYLINSDVYRLNLSGQTDTTELIGRFTPNDGVTQRQYDALVSGWDSSNETVRQNVYNRVSAASAELMQQAYLEKRALNREENVKIAEAAGITISEGNWVWKNGMLPFAMINGGILILDEATLTTPEVIERVNSALEQPASLVLSENGGITIGPGGDYTVNPNFWVMGTGNSAGMAGRSLFSEAFQRRLADYFIAADPTKEEYSQMLKFMIFGKQPVIVRDGITYSFPDDHKTETPFAKLASIPKIEKFIQNLAAFHEDMVKLTDSRAGTIGKDRRQGGKYVISRQNLLSIMQFLAQERILDVKQTVLTGEPVYSTDWKRKAQLALERFYVDPVSENDRQAVRDAINKYPVAGVL